MSPKILKIYVERGRTSQVDETHWNKRTFGIEADVTDLESEEAVNTTKRSLDEKLQTWLQETEISPEAVSALGIPKIDPAELDECGWQTFQKQPAKPGQAAWIKNPVAFTSWQDPPAVLLELVKALARTKDHEIVLGDMKYVYGGPKDKLEQFIHRKPVKEESAR